MTLIRDIAYRGHNYSLLNPNRWTDFVTMKLGAGAWETETFDTIDSYRGDGTFIDIGAWIGMMSLYASHRYTNVISFEPDPAAHTMAAANIEMNHATNIDLHQEAVMGRGQSNHLRVHEELGSSMTGVRRDGPAFPVNAITVDQLRQMCPNPRLVKCDIEGGEEHIWDALLDWGVPLHLSLHMPMLTSYSEPDWRGREIEYQGKEADFEYFSVLVK